MQALADGVASAWNASAAWTACLSKHGFIASAHQADKNARSLLLSGRTAVRRLGAICHAFCDNPLCGGLRHHCQLAKGCGLCQPSANAVLLAAWLAADRAVHGALVW